MIRLLQKVSEVLFKLNENGYWHSDFNTFSFLIGENVLIEDCGAIAQASFPYLFGFTTRFGSPEFI